MRKRRKLELEAYASLTFEEALEVAIERCERLRDTIEAGIKEQQDGQREMSENLKS